MIFTPATHDLTPGSWPMWVSVRNYIMNTYKVASPGCHGLHAMSLIYNSRDCDVSKFHQSSKGHNKLTCRDATVFKSTLRQLTH